jgi:hypothetical protein
MSIPSVDAHGQDARHVGALALTIPGGILEAPAEARKRASASMGDLSRT